MELRPDSTIPHKVTYMRRGRPRKDGVARTDSGRISRAKSGGMYAVYVAYLPLSKMVKVGRTGDVRGRMSSLSASIGERPVVCAEFYYVDRDTSIKAEGCLIDFLLGRGFKADGREWFHIDMEELPSIVAAFGANSHGAVAVNSMGEYRDSPVDGGYDVRRLLKGHIVNEARM